MGTSKQSTRMLLVVIAAALLCMTETRYEARDSWAQTAPTKGKPKKGQE